MSELNKESVEQAGGDERAAFEAYRDRRNALLESEGHNPGSKWHVTNAHYPTWEASREAMAQPSPAPELELLRSALSHIIKTCGQSRTETRRLRWIAQRAQWALDGKPYDISAFDLPKYSATAKERLEREVKVLREYARGLPAPVAQAQHSVPDVCDSKEQNAFEDWASKEGMNMERHPLHWLFLDAKTYSARQGWKAALKYARNMLAAAPVCRLSRSALTDAQMRRLYDSSTETENERLGFAAFARLIRRAEAVHQIAAAPGKEVGHE